MDAINFFLLRYGDLHRGLIGDLLGKLSAAQVRGRPHPGVNTVAWLLWHTARVEDVGVNRFIADRPQALEDGWLDRLGIPRSSCARDPLPRGGNGSRRPLPGPLSSGRCPTRAGGDHE